MDSIAGFVAVPALLLTRQNTWAADGKTREH